MIMIANINMAMMNCQIKNWKIVFRLLLETYKVKLNCLGYIQLIKMLFTLLHLLHTRMNNNKHIHCLIMYGISNFKFDIFCSIFHFITDRKKMYTNQLTSRKENSTYMLEYKFVYLFRHITMLCMKLCKLKDLNY